MARQPDIQYVQYYTGGSAARKLEPEKRQIKNGAKLPQVRRRRQKRKVICIDPISVCALMVAVGMVIAMAVGMLRLGNLTDQADRMGEYATAVEQENAALRAEYRAGYDLHDVEQKALDMGLVPEDQLRHITVKAEVPESEPELTGWQEFCRFVSEMFA